MPHVACYMPVVTWHVACRMSRGMLHADFHVACCMLCATWKVARHAAGPQRVRAVGRDGVDRSGKCERASVAGIAWRVRTHLSRSIGPVNGPECEPAVYGSTRQFPTAPIRALPCLILLVPAVPRMRMLADAARACRRHAAAAPTLCENTSTISRSTRIMLHRGTLSTHSKALPRRTKVVPRLQGY
jgi:hypothetical protein